MTLVVSLGALILPGSLTAAGTAATTAGALGAASAGAGVGAAGGALSGALIGGTAGTAAGLSSLGAGIAGTVGAGALGAAGAGINEMVQSADAADAAPARGVANQPTLAAGLAPAQAPAAAAAGPLAGIGSENSMQGAAEGGIMMAKGGHVPLKDGAYIIPADVVSALGNGSTKAGGQFLRQLIESVKDEATKRQGLGAVHKQS
jgi:hypothetical protein